MSHPTVKTLFIAGTDTDVGKTYVASLIARRLRGDGLRVGVYKPVASGCRSVDGQMVADDAVSLRQSAGRVGSLDDVCPQRFLAPLAPPEAARAEGESVDAELLRTGADRWKGESDLLIVEGAGGLFSPLADGVLNIDLAKQLGAVLVIVAANRLGVIHQTLSTCAAATHHGAEPAGIILSDPTGDGDDSVSTNAAQIARYCRLPLLGSVPFGGNEDDVAGIQKLLS